MEALVPIIMFGSVPIVLLLFALLPPRRAAIAGMLGAWLFLPIKTYEFVGLPDISKISVISLTLLLAIILFDFKRLVRFRPHWVDIPIFIWCFVPVASSLTNGLGLYDGLSEAFGQIISWGVPYFIGRLYFSEWDGLKELSTGMVVAGVVYTPLLLLELWRSPQLHNFVYGYHQHQFAQTLRWGRYRPMVFMDHGLMVGMFMAAVAIIAVWSWRSGAIKKLWRIPFVYIMVGLVTMSILTLSANGWIWLTLGLVTLFASTYLRRAWPLYLLILFIPLYTFSQGISIWPSDTAVEFATGLFGPDRAQSLGFRYYNESFLTAKARQQWVFGWGGWDRQHVFFEWGPRTVADSLWVIAFGKFGALGLTSLITTLLLPAFLLARRFPPWLWNYERVGGGAAMAVVLVLYMYDGLLNAMLNPIYMLMAGGVLGVCAARQAVKVAAPTPPTLQGAPATT